MAGFEVIIYGRFWVITEDSRAISHFLCAHFAVEPANANHLGQYFESFEVLTGKCAMCGLRHHVTEERT